jgi:DNA polymerase-3 subunit epsilon
MRSWHDALFDAVASLVLLAHLIDSHALMDQPLASLLHPDTSAWHARRRA